MKQLIPRNFDRTRFLGKASIHVARDAHPVSGEVLNLGRGGAAFFSRSFITPGQGVEVVFHVSKTVPAAISRRIGRVTSAQALPDGNIVRVAFAEALTDKDVKLLKENRS